jgi:hypothetical protein
MRIFFAVLGLMFFGTGASAQQLAVLTNGANGGLCSFSGCFSPDVTISASTLLAPTNAAVAAQGATIASMISAIENNRRTIQESAALASAITIMPPEKGDRFSLTVSGADANGYGAGSISGTYRITERMLAFGGYARSSTQNLGKAGLSMSFH